jgi:hypothetical protein
MNTISKIQAGVKVNTAIKAGGFTCNHSRKINGLSVKSGIKAGGFTCNHSRKISGLSVKSGIKAGEGIYASNHSRRLA